MTESQNRVKWRQMKEQPWPSVPRYVSLEKNSIEISALGEQRSTFWNSVQHEKLVHVNRISGNSLREERARTLESLAALDPRKLRIRVAWKMVLTRWWLWLHREVLDEWPSWSWTAWLKLPCNSSLDVQAQSKVCLTQILEMCYSCQSLAVRSSAGTS